MASDILVNFPMLFQRAPFYALALLGACLSLVASGCGARTTTLTGTVQYQGQPVSSGSVILYCADKQIVRGMIDANGSYSIPNVPPGRATMTVQSEARVPAGMKFQQKLPPSVNGPVFPAVEHGRGDRVMSIPRRYAHPEESGLIVNINRNNAIFNIDLTP